MLYQVKITETVSQEWVIDAKTPDDALRKVAEQYNKGKIVLEPGNLEETTFTCENTTHKIIQLY